MSQELNGGLRAMISNLIVLSTLFLGALFTALTIIRPEFRARIEQPKYAFLRQLSMYEKSTGVGRQGGESEIATESKSENKSESGSDSKTKPAVRTQ